MSKVAHSFRRGLEQAVADAGGEAKEGAYRVHVPALIDMRAIRTKLGMTQEKFAGILMQQRCRSLGELPGPLVGRGPSPRSVILSIFRVRGYGMSGSSTCRKH